MKDGKELGWMVKKVTKVPGKASVDASSEWSRSITLHPAEHILACRQWLFISTLVQNYYYSPQSFKTSNASTY